MMKSVYFYWTFGLLSLLATLPKGTTSQTPRVKVITHNLAGAFCKIQAFNDVEFTDDEKLMKAIEIMRDYKSIADSLEAVEVVIFHFQEVCEAKRSTMIAWNLKKWHQETYKIILEGLSATFSDRKCKPLLNLINFSTYVCYKNIEEASDPLPAPRIELTNEWNSKTLDYLLKAMKDAPEQCRNKNSPCLPEEFEWSLNNGKEQTVDEINEELRKNMNCFAQRALTKGAIIAPIVFNYQGVKVGLKPIKLWLVSANVHFSSKKLLHRRRQLEKTYKAVIELETTLRKTAARNDDFDHVFFSFVAGDFNSRVYHHKSSEITVRDKDGKFDWIPKITAPHLLMYDDKGSPEDDQTLKELLMCMLFQKKFGESNYSKVKIETMTSSAKSLLNNFTNKCVLVYKDYLETKEEFRGEVIYGMIEHWWSQMKQEGAVRNLIEPKLDGLNFPTFVFNVYAKYTKPSINILEETLQDLVHMIKTNSQSKELPNWKTDPFLDIFGYLPKMYQSKAGLSFSTFNDYRNFAFMDIDDDKESVFDQEIQSKIIWKLLDYAIYLKPTTHETPAWCDRLMYLSAVPGDLALKKTEYRAYHHVRFSDHVPVSFTAEFDLSKVKDKNQKESSELVININPTQPNEADYLLDPSMNKQLDQILTKSISESHSQLIQPEVEKHIEAKNDQSNSKIIEILEEQISIEEIDDDPNFEFDTISQEKSNSSEHISMEVNRSVDSRSSSFFDEAQIDIKSPESPFINAKIASNEPTVKMTILWTDVIEFMQSLGAFNQLI